MRATTAHTTLRAALETEVTSILLQLAPVQAIARINTGSVGAARGRLKAVIVDSADSEYVSCVCNGRLSQLH